MRLFVVYIFFVFCFNFEAKCQTKTISETKVSVGAENLQEYLHLLRNKKVGLVVNNTSKIGDEHLVDVLLSKNIKITRIFAPEHGFRGDVTAGELIKDSKDPKTGIEIVSLYGKNKKPTAQQLADLDIIVFDIQDVGARFYTYISTLHYLMEACGENKKCLLLLDRPNPNGHYVAGPVLDLKFQSFVGMNPIPVVHGLTVGEYAQMNNGEKWIKTKCELKIIKCKNYTHKTIYVLPEKPSPNLPNQTAIWLYPSLCLLEPTQISVGRGTNKQFQILGGPDDKLGKFTFTPQDMPGAKDPVDEGKLCYGEDLSQENAYHIPFTLAYFIKYYNNFSDKEKFFSNKKFFNNLIGNDWVLKEIVAGKNAEQIAALWKNDLEKYKKRRKKYLLYTDYDTNN